MERVRKPKQPDEKRSRESQGDGADRKKKNIDKNNDNSFEDKIL